MLVQLLLLVHRAKDRTPTSLAPATYAVLLANFALLQLCVQPLPLRLPLIQPLLQLAYVRLQLKATESTGTLGAVGPPSLGFCAHDPK